MNNITEKYLDKELVDSMPEKLPEDYDEWLDAQQPDEQQLEYMAKLILAFDDALNKIVGKSPF